MASDPVVLMIWEINFGMIGWINFYFNVWTPNVNNLFDSLASMIKTAEKNINLMTMLRLLRQSDRRLVDYI